MALLRIPEEGETLADGEAIATRLADAGIAYERWEPSHPVRADAAPAEILAAYGDEIERLKREGGYVTADVIDVHAQTPGLEAMLARFNREHWHDEDEVRFIIQGSGLFHIRPRAGSVLGIEVEAGDLLRVPRGRGTVRPLPDAPASGRSPFPGPSGWTPHYTETGAEAGFEPVCLGPGQIAGRGAPR
jgi:1,2-dihydroxy-3-keto-5-methylthiopentene dioxygenase